MVKKSIGIDSRKTKSVFIATVLIVDRYILKSIAQFTPQVTSWPHRNEQAQWRAPPFPATPKKLRPPCSDSRAGVSRVARETRLQHLAAKNYCTFSSLLFFDPTAHQCRPRHKIARERQAALTAPSIARIFSALPCASLHGKRRWTTA